MVDLSFVIPAFNEERLLPLVLKSIRHNIRHFRYEIIVVDNGSSDETRERALSNSAVVLVDPNAAIGGLRNLGVSKASGNVIVFLDADVLITPSWELALERRLPLLAKGAPPLVTGSRYGIPEQPSWIERNWFGPMTEERANYINGGHLIMNGDTFRTIGGFDPALRTGEDWEFCRRAAGMGVDIENDPTLVVIHEGYPKTLSQFIKRERWHGSQDVASLRRLVASKPALLGILYWVTLLMGFALMGLTKSVIPVAAATVLVSLVCLNATIAKRRRHPLPLLPYFLLYHAYFFARGLSLYDRMRGRFRTKENVL